MSENENKYERLQSGLEDGLSRQINNGEMTPETAEKLLSAFAKLLADGFGPAFYYEYKRNGAVLIRIDNDGSVVVVPSEDSDNETDENDETEEVSDSEDAPR